MGTRRQARIAAMGYLYQQEAGVETTTADLHDHLRHFEVPENFRAYAIQLAEGVKEHRGEIDQKLQEAAEHWKLYRMPKVDRSVLRIALYELLYCPETPAKVIIDEAVDISKLYGAQDSGSFVNGILDQVARASRAGEFKE